MNKQTLDVAKLILYGCITNSIKKFPTPEKLQEKVKSETETKLNKKLSPEEWKWEKIVSTTFADIPSTTELRKMFAMAKFFGNNLSTFIAMYDICERSSSIYGVNPLVLAILSTYHTYQVRKGKNIKWSKKKARWYMVKTYNDFLPYNTTHGRISLSYVTEKVLIKIVTTSLAHVEYLSELSVKEYRNLRKCSTNVAKNWRIAPKVKTATA